MYQKIILVGNLGGDPEMRYMPDGTAVTSFSLATSRRWNDAQGKPVEETTWFRVSIWGKRAEAANQYLTKGSKVLVEGRLKPDPNTGAPRLYNKQDGTPAASYEVTADNFSFVGSKSENAERDDSPAPAKNSAQRANSAPIEEDDIPF
jgi:single-strand DNA-binding protein